MSREEPGLLLGSVLSTGKGSSFTLPSVHNLFDNGTLFVDSKVGRERTSDMVKYEGLCLTTFPCNCGLKGVCLIYLLNGN